jgi:hypothetical protein
MVEKIEWGTLCEVTALTQAQKDVALYRRAIAALILGESFAGDRDAEELIAEFSSAIYEARNAFPGRV